MTDKINSDNIFKFIELLLNWQANKQLIVMTSAFETEY